VHLVNIEGEGKKGLTGKGRGVHINDPQRRISIVHGKLKKDRSKRGGTWEDLKRGL